MTDTMQAPGRLERWLRVSDENEQIVAQVLATALSVTPSALSRVASIGLAATRTGEGRATERLLRRPFVEHLDGGYRISEPFASQLRRRFKENYPTAHAEVSDALLRIETERLSRAESNNDQWFTRGRIAFYLAAIDPEESAERFLDAFAHPPSGDPGPPRSWLANLVFKQYNELAHQGRTIAFFQAWMAYKSGRFREAGRDFETVVESTELDAARAVSLHLLSIIQPQNPRSEEDLHEAIALSHDLGLLENEVMATNSLVYRLVTRAERNAGDRDDIHAAAVLARDNLRNTGASGDEYLRVWCLSASAQTSWLDASRLRAEAESVPPDVVHAVYQLLDAARVLAWRIRDFESFAEAVNTRAQIHRDLGEYESAIATLEAGLTRLHEFDPPRAANRWGKTAGSMRRQAGDLTVTKRTNLFLRRFNRWNSTDG